MVHKVLTPLRALSLKLVLLLTSTKQRQLQCPDDECLNNLGEDSNFVDILKEKAEGSCSLSLAQAHKI